MGSPAIEVRNLSKSYRLGHVGFTSLRSELERWWARWRRHQTTDNRGEFWALRDVSFDIAPGEVTGIIGRNGAGKSTLLKILSEITEPTAGEVRLRGQVGSMLEVGTGFHPELSGRENIFLIGATLGMKRAEIRRKFDEIVAFAEVEKFLDTPVKRYSSGMYVRLGFAVAAHLDPEILLIDEVLAVGDHAFQQRCLGKMQDVARRDGRTVLFVSHNMASVSRLCEHAILLREGRVAAMGNADKVVADYLVSTTDARAEWRRPADRPLGHRVNFLAARVCDVHGVKASILPYTSPITLVFECHERDTYASWILIVSVFDRHGHEILSTRDSEAAKPRQSRPGQSLRATCSLPGALLKPGTYRVRVAAHELWGDTPITLYEEHDPILTFEVSEQNFHAKPSTALVAPCVDWQFESGAD